jgi:hypothetical protein
MSVNNGKINEFPKSRRCRESFLTVNDFIEFKDQLISEIRKLLSDQMGNTGKKWLKSLEVRNLLNTFRGTLQNLRASSTLSYTKIGGVSYYDYKDIQSVFLANKSD